ncbi:uncharacterized protein LOC143623412 [Bidens hawaiensis]|uniref:uncharacterized protein LOC143623412 n=1 Tax=Bidens hawaiensis TaxID=980011 RepID=UPI004049D5F8
MQGIWGEIERRDPNPMVCDVDISTYNNIRAEHKLFQILNALDKQYDPIKREILRWDPLASAEAAYVTVRKETAQQVILEEISSNAIPQQNAAAGLVSRGPNETEGSDLISKGQRQSDHKTDKSSSRIDKSRLKCSHYGMAKHTKDQCFKPVGYPERWNDSHKKGVKGGGMAVATKGNSKVADNGEDHP